MTRNNEGDDGAYRYTCSIEGLDGVWQCLSQRHFNLISVSSTDGYWAE